MEKIKCYFLGKGGISTTVRAFFYFMGGAFAMFILFPIVISNYDIIGIILTSIILVWSIAGFYVALEEMKQT
ncbi:MAG: hypothetical protein E3J73_02785 [Candidatus Bathyarchaeum sp.]|nr:MAG: hypothetical protein E3J73_02785 [Candidatus Bathyarchaeum sp.]